MNIEESRVDKAVSLFQQGYNCAQSVFAAYADLYGIDKETALKLSASFGGGMGRMRQVCGAVSGMFMVNGLANGSTDPSDREAKAHNYAMVQQLAAAFKEENGSIVCGELLAGKIEKPSTGPVPSERTAEYYHKRPCAEYVRKCAQLIEEQLCEREMGEMGTVLLSLHHGAKEGKEGPSPFPSGKEGPSPLSPIILCIETSTAVCSVALGRGNDILYKEENHDGQSHAVQLGIFLDKALKVLEQKGLQLSAVAVSSGPGSYTGLRIGVSMAKGVCYARQIPLIAIPSLQVTAAQVHADNDTLLCPMTDARRMEVYTAVYDNLWQPVSETQALIVDAGSLSDLPADKRILVFGDGAAKAAKVIKREGVTLLDGLYPRAEDMLRLAAKAYETGRFEDVAYFEPFYLKEFQATVPHKLNDLIHKETI